MASILVSPVDALADAIAPQADYLHCLIAVLANVNLTDYSFPVYPNEFLRYEQNLIPRFKTLATTRIQQEIAEQEEREKSLLIHHLDNKVIDIAKPQPEVLPVVMKEPLQRSVSAEKEVKTPTMFKPNPNAGAGVNRGNRRLTGYAGLHKLMNPAGSLVGNSVGSNNTKGLMEKFLASRGKMTNVMPTFNKSVDPSIRTSKPQQRPSPKKTESPMQTIATAVKAEDGAPTSRRQISGAAKQIMRRTYATAEEKIQLELQEMKQREKELRYVSTPLLCVIC
ncbi:unnamed protein product, partial [Notodromas monacha]